MHERYRFDFAIVQTVLDEATRTARFELKPDPLRYETRTIDGEKFYYDKLDDTLIPETMVLDMVEKAPSLPFNFLSQRVGDAVTYVEGRKANIRAALKEKVDLVSLADPSDELLSTLAANKREFVILSLDLVGSTRLANTASPDSYLRLMQTVLFEVSELVPLFHGHVLKYTGDGIIAYFPAPSFINKNDLAIDCAATMRRLVRDGLNPLLIECGHEAINVRIGLDAGAAAVVAIGSPATKQQMDIIGAVVSLACKIQSRAPEGEIAIGDVAFKNLHTNWRLWCAAMEAGTDWPYTEPGSDRPYKIHLLQLP